MTVTLATKTVALIDRMIEADQGASYRGWLAKVLPHIGDAYRQENDGFRSHMGGSVLGGECGRAMWYGFHWTTKPAFPGRVMRLFNRGHLEEGRFIAMLLMIGVQVYQQDANGKQFRIAFAGGHGGGSGDGVGIGIPDLQPEMAALLEFKTHNDASFVKLKKEGVRASKFEHYVQTNTYMRKMGLPVTLYLAVNKNTDELYGEIIPLDVAVADQFIDRGTKIIFMKELPPKINNSPGWFACKWCDHKSVCHFGDVPARNCRTCDSSRPQSDGTWLCINADRQRALVSGDNPKGEDFSLSKERQETGCETYYKAFK